MEWRQRLRQLSCRILRNVGILPPDYTAPYTTTHNLSVCGNAAYLTVISRFSNEVQKTPNILRTNSFLSWPKKTNGEFLRSPPCLLGCSWLSIQIGFWERYGYKRHNKEVILLYPFENTWSCSYTSAIHLVLQFQFRLGNVYRPTALVLVSVSYGCV